MRYELQLLEGVPFTVESGKQEYEILPRASTVVVKTIDDKGKTTKKKYGFVEREEIYSLVETGQLINLNHCYIAGFSLKEYKQKRNIDKDPYVLVKLEGARKAFFDTRESLERVNVKKSVYPEKNMTDYDNERYIAVDFSGARFSDGDVNFSGAKFGDGDVHFSRAKFSDGAVDFSVSKFGDGTIDFSGAEFGAGPVDFSRAEFGDGYMDFSGAEFGEGTVDFSGAKFGEGDVDFSWADFGGGDVDFSWAEFGKGEVRLYSAKFGEGEVRFYKVKFGEGTVDFSFIDRVYRNENSISQTVIAINYCYFRDHINMKKARCKILMINNCTIEKTLNLEGLEVEKLSLKNTKNLGQIFLKWTEDKVAERLEADSYQKMSDQVVMLKENFHTIGRYDDEDKAYVMYKRYQWLVTRDELRKGKSYLIPFHFLKKIAYDWISEYGTNYIRVAGSMLAIWASFTLLYCIFPGILYKSVSEYSVSHIPNIGECISYSIATFLTIGFGNITPLTSLAVILSGLEGFSGVFLTAYFTVAFARKVLR
jgi:uncharacterized protein YjbI with pentapeptide repeats